MLEQTTNKAIPKIKGLDSSYIATSAQAEKEYAEYIINRVSRLADQFKDVTVQGTKAPIVVPD